MSKTKKYIILIILLILSFIGFGCTQNYKLETYEQYMKELIDISHLEGDYYNGNVRGDRRRDVSEEKDFYYQVKYIQDQNDNNKEKYTFYLANIDLDNYYVLSSYTTKDNKKNIVTRANSGWKVRMEYYKSLSWIKYDKLEDVKEEYEGLELVESYVVAKITLIKDILNDITYNKTINYYKIPKYEKTVENENILLWFYKDINDIDTIKDYSDESFQDNPKYIGYPQYIYAQDVCYGEDINNTYSEDLVCYALIKDYHIKTTSEKYLKIYSQINSHLIHNEIYDLYYKYEDTEYNHMGTEYKVERFMLDINIIKDICLGFINSNNITVTFKYSNEEISTEIEKNKTIDETLLSSLNITNIEGIYYDSEYNNKYNNEPLNEDIILYVKERTFDAPTPIDGKLCGSTSGSSANENRIISTYEEFCEKFYYSEEAKQHYYNRGFIYDEEFFKENSLVLAFYSHNNTGNFIVLDEMIRHNNKLTINVSLASGYMNAFTNAFLIFEVNKKDVENVNKITLEKNVVDGEKITVTFIINGEEYKNEMQKLNGLSKDQVINVNPNITKEDIEGLYLDSAYTIKYDNEFIKEDTTIYVKLKDNKCTIRSDISVPIQSISFNNGEELEDFIINNKIKCLYITEITKQDEILDAYNVIYTLYFDEEEDGEYVNSCVSIEFSLYSNLLGTDTDSTMDVQYHSISFLCNFKNYKEISELSFEFYNYENDKYKYNNLIYIYSEDIQIGEIYYYDRLDISHDWIIDFLNENIK